MSGKTDQIKGRIKEAAGVLTITTASNERESSIIAREVDAVEAGKLGTEDKEGLS